MKKHQKQKKNQKTTLEKRSHHQIRKFIKKEKNKRNQKMVDKRSKHQNESTPQRKKESK
jgi:hypothetical protein